AGPGRRLGAGVEPVAVVTHPDRPDLARPGRVDLELDLDPAVVRRGLELPRGRRVGAAAGADDLPTLGLGARGTGRDHGERDDAGRRDPEPLLRDHVAHVCLQSWSAASCGVGQACSEATVTRHWALVVIPRGA